MREIAGNFRVYILSLHVADFALVDFHGLQELLDYFVAAACHLLHVTYIENSQVGAVLGNHTHSVVSELAAATEIHLLKLANEKQIKTKKVTRQVTISVNGLAGTLVLLCQNFTSHSIFGTARAISKPIFFLIYT